MNGAVVSRLSERLESFRQSDAERDALVAELITAYEDLKLKFSEQQDDYDNEKKSRRFWQNKVSTLEQSLTDLEKSSLKQKQNNFVVALIDGDGALFRDSLYAAGREGGAEAARELETALQNHLRKLYPDESHDRIIVNVICNLQGLSHALARAGVIKTPGELQAFGQAFGLANPLFNFIDVGVGKERADHKIKETLRLYLPIAQCQHVFFAPCHDNGYLPVLESYRKDRQRITLIETRPSEPGFKNLDMTQISIPNVFRSEDLDVRSATTVSPVIRTVKPVTVATNGALAAAKVPARSSSADSTSNDNSWATISKAVPKSKIINIAPEKTQQRPFILLNSYDDRLDEKLPQPDRASFDRFNEIVERNGKNFCNSFHLTGHCDSGDYCYHDHSSKLGPGELLVLRLKARSRPCTSGSTCRDSDCTYGHHCKYGQFCTLEKCYFSSTHGLDLEPAKRWFGYDDEEWLKSYLNKARK